MLKRIASALLALAIILCFCACKQTDPEKKPDTTTTETDSTTESKVFSHTTESEPECSTNSTLAECETTSQTTGTSDETELETTSETKVDTSHEPENNIQPTDPNNQQNSTESQTDAATIPTQPTKPGNKPEHTHTYSDATCTSPKKCSCGATSGEALGHNWQDATCTAPKTCKVCNITEGTAAQHKFERYVCVNCNYTDEEGIAIATNPKLSFTPKLYRTYRYDVSTSHWYTCVDCVRIKFNASNLSISASIDHCRPEKDMLTAFPEFSDFQTWPIDNDALWAEYYYIIYNGEKYYSTTGTGGPVEGWYYELTDTEIIVYNGTKVMLKFKMNVDGSLIVTYAEQPPFCGGDYFIVGDIFW